MSVRLRPICCRPDFLYTESRAEIREQSFIQTEICDVNADIRILCNTKSTQNARLELK